MDYSATHKISKAVSIFVSLIIYVVVLLARSLRSDPVSFFASLVFEKVASDGKSSSL